MFYAYFSIQTHKDIPGKHYNFLVKFFYAYFSLQTHKDTPWKHYNSLVKYVLCIFFMRNTEGYPRAILHFFFFEICLMLFFHYKHTRIPQGSITILWLYMFYDYFPLQTKKDTPEKHYNYLVNMLYTYFSLQTHKDTPGKYYNSLVKYVLCLFFITNTQGYPRETLHFFG